MQDYFKYDKIQGGAPLRMKSDSDGVTDGQDSTTPLGIKTTAEGIKHFTNWDDISNSLEAQNKARFDDTQPNALKFSMNNARAVFKDIDRKGIYPVLMHGGDRSNDNPFYKRRQSRVDFEDRWDAEDITILDDMAFVSYPDYTDIHRADLQLKNDINKVQLQQLAYFDDDSQTQLMHSTLRFDSQLNLQKVLELGRHDTNRSDSTAFRSLDFTSLDNSILKIKFTKGADGRLSYNGGAEQFSDQPSGDTSTTSTPEVLYFVYGGVLENAKISLGTATGVRGNVFEQTTFADVPTGTPYLGETGTQFDRSTITSSSDKSPLQDINGNAISGANNKQVVGKFYLVPFAPDRGIVRDAVANTYKIPETNFFGIQLDITSRWAEDPLSSGSTTLKPNADGTGAVANWSLYLSGSLSAAKGVAGSRFAAINNGIASPDDNDYIRNQLFQGDSAESLFLGFEVTPSDFANATSISLKIRERCDALNPSSCGVRYQIFKSDGATALTNQLEKRGTSGDFNSTFTDREYVFTLTGDTDKSSWDGALLKLEHFEANGDDTTYDVSEIQLDLEYEISTLAEISTNYAARKALFREGVSQGNGKFEAYTVDTEEITLIKITPVRKCGKVDVYTRKKGIIDAVVGNTLTSPGHTLNSNDVIEISSALFDGSQAGYADIHPMNGKKFVRKIDDDTFEIFDDQFFQDETDTSFLRSTMGINWICISSNYGSIGQSWDYYNTIFSPTGRNGYLSGIDPTGGIFVGTADSLSDPVQFITNKRINTLDATKSNSLGSRTSGVVDFDFRNSFDNPNFAKVIDESVPKRFDSANPLSNFQYAPQDFYPYYCSNISDQPLVGFDSDEVKLDESKDASLYTTTAYDGCRFGSALDVKFSHVDGDSKVYTLAVGERGSDISVDLFGVEQSECHIDTYAQNTSNLDTEYDETVVTHGRVSHYNSIDTYDRGIVLTENFRKRPMPFYLPYGKTHVITITVDRYGKISDISHVNTLFGGGDDILHADNNTNLQSFRETNPWKAFERQERSYYLLEDRTASPPSYPINRTVTSTTMADSGSNPSTDPHGGFFGLYGSDGSVAPLDEDSGSLLRDEFEVMFEEVLSDGLNDPWVAIFPGRGTYGSASDDQPPITQSYHTLRDFTTTLDSPSDIDDNETGYVTNVSISAVLSKSSGFDAVTDSDDDHSFKFTIVKEDYENQDFEDTLTGALTSEIQFVVNRDTSPSTINLQSVESGNIINELGLASTIREWKNAKILLDVNVSIDSGDATLRMYRIHELSVNITINEVPDAPVTQHEPLAIRSYEARDLFQEPEYWQNINNQHTSKYWLRAAALHWYPQDIFDYKCNRIVSDFPDASKVSRIRAYNHNSYSAIHANNNAVTTPIIRRDVTVTKAGNSDVAMSRFGYSGFTETPSTPEFFEINRFQNSTAYGNDISRISQWYIFPWVDSFGKSVALQNVQDGVCVLSGCRSRANEELNAGYLNNGDGSPVSEILPLQPSNSSSDRAAFPRLTEPETKSKIGHINIAILRNTSFAMIEFNELNSGGAIFTKDFQSDNDIILSVPSTTESTPQVPVKYVKLPTGTDAGFGMPEVINSTELSNSKIVWKDDYILFAEQDLYNSRSLIHIFKYDDVAGFQKHDEISVSFVDMVRGGADPSSWIRNVSPAYNTGDGFGFNFRYDKDLLVTNHMRSDDQFGDDIADKMARNSLGWSATPTTGSGRVDTLCLYERRLVSGNKKFRFVQNIYPSVNFADDKQYPTSLITTLRNSPIDTDEYNYKYLMPLDTLTYDNDVSHSLTWNINWCNKYDVVDSKIIIKDPLEYSLYASTFVDNYDNYAPYVTSTSLELDRYLAFTERVEAGWQSAGSFVKYDYSPLNGVTFTSQDKAVRGRLSDEGATNQSITSTPVMFFNLSIENIDTLNDITIQFQVSNNNAANLSYYEGENKITESLDSLIPRIVLYKKDPRSTIIFNGPADSDSRLGYYPQYTRGIFTRFPKSAYVEQFWDAAISDYLNPDSTELSAFNEQHQAFFRGGAADLFFYGSLPISSVVSKEKPFNNSVAPGYQNIRFPVYCGGDKNLGEYFDLTWGLHGSAGIPAWVSNDVLNIPFLTSDDLSFSTHINNNNSSEPLFEQSDRLLINPYAKLFKPEVIDGSVVNGVCRIVIPAESLRDFIIDGTLIKGSSDDRPFFGNSPTDALIYNDTQASPGFDDVNKSTYANLNGDVNKTIAIGFVMTNVTNHKIGEPSEFEGSMALRTIDPVIRDRELDEIDGGQARYPYSCSLNTYSSHAASTQPDQYAFNYNRMENLSFGAFEFNLAADIQNVSITANSKTISRKKYSNKFHKTAIFDYHQEASDDVKATTIGLGDVQVVEEPFVRSNFSPSVVGLSNPKFNTSLEPTYNFNYADNQRSSIKSDYVKRDLSVLQSQDSVVRFSNTSDAPAGSGAMVSSTAIQNRGSYSKSIQVLNSENLIYNDSSYYVDVNDGTPVFTIPPTGHILGEALFRRSSLLGGFDIYDPEFVPLFINPLTPADVYADLYTNGMEVASGLIPLKTRGVDGFTDDMPLKIGVAFASGTTTLFTNSPAFNSLSLFTIETPPSAIRPLYTTGPDVSGGLNLVIDVPITGGRPLYTQGPTQVQTIHPSQSGLYTRGSIDHNFRTDLFMPTFDVSSSDPSLYIEHGAPDEAQISLTFSPGFSGVTPLFLEVPTPATGGMPTYLEVPEPSNSGVDLYMNPFAGVSGLPSLYTQGPFNGSGDMLLFTGPRASSFAVAPLYIDTPRPVESDTQLFTQSIRSTSNSNVDGDGEVILKYRNGLLLDGDNTEQTITKIISDTDDVDNVQEINSNSITYPTLFDVDGSNSTIRTDSTLNDVPESTDVTRRSMGSYAKLLRNTDNDNQPSTYDPIFNLKAMKTSESKLIGWYNDLATKPTLINESKSVIRDEMFASNGKYVVVASHGHSFSNSTTGGLVSIYKINNDGSLTFDTRLNTVYFDLQKAASGTEVLGSVAGIDIVDGFYSIRPLIYDLLTDSDLDLQYTPPPSTTDYGNETRVKISDISISQQNKCAIALRGVFPLSGRPLSEFDSMDIIVEFDILDYISSQEGFSTNQVTATIRQNSSSVLSESNYYGFSGNSLSYCGEDLNYTQTTLRSASVTELVYRKRTQGSLISTYFHPNHIPDAQLYLNNISHIGNYDKLTGFGYVVKSFDRYETNDKIIFVSAPLFDPYLNNTLTSSYRVNPMGAVYIFIQSLGSTDWTYQGAVYAKGYTSSNITSNLDQYKNGQLNDEFALFGYDLDYKQDVLVVSEPGGNSTGTTNDTSAGRCYRFDLTDPSSPLLLNVYSASNLRKDPVDAASAAIDVNDNFGSSVVLMSKKDVITWSDANIEKEISSTTVGDMTLFKNDSTLYNLNTGRYFGFQDNAGDNYDSNIFNEVKEYFPLVLRNLNPDDIKISSRILAMKKLHFGSTIKLGILREFSVKSPIVSDPESRFKLKKLSIVEPSKINGLTLFIEAPAAANEDASLINKGITSITSDPKLFMPRPVLNIEAEPSLFVSQKGLETDTSLNIEAGRSVFIPLYQSGTPAIINNDISLVLPVIEMENDVPLNISSLTDHILTTDIIIGGAANNQATGPSHLFIGQEAHKNTLTHLFVNNQYAPPTVSPGAVGTFNQASIRISGNILYSATTQNIGTGLSPSLDLQGPPFFVAGPDSASGIIASPLYITTDIPPTGETGLSEYNLGMNLALPVSETAGSLIQDNTLFIKQRATDTATTSLYIERNQPVATTVFVSGVGVGTGVMPLSVEATFTDNENTTLIIKPLPAVGINLTSRGFVE